MQSSVESDMEYEVQHGNDGDSHSRRSESRRGSNFSWTEIVLAIEIKELEIDLSHVINAGFSRSAIKSSCGREMETISFKIMFNFKNGGETLLKKVVGWEAISDFKKLRIP